MSKKKMNKGEVVAARADGSVIMQWQKGEKKVSFSDVFVVASGTVDWFCIMKPDHKRITACYFKVQA